MGRSIRMGWQYGLLGADLGCDVAGLTEDHPEQFLGPGEVERGHVEPGRCVWLEEHGSWSTSLPGRITGRIFGSHVARSR